MTYPISTNAYSQSVGITNVPQILHVTTDPTQNTTQYPLFQQLFNTQNLTLWLFVGLTSSQGVVTAVWQRTAVGLGGAVYTLTGNSGGAISSDSDGNINIVGDGTGLTITGSGTTLTATISGGGFGWNSVTSATQTLAANQGYVVNNAGSMVTFTLPSTAVVGDTYIIQGKTSLGWKVNVTTGQTLHLGNRATTASTGSIASTDQWDSVTITCVTASTTFACRGVQGTITVA